MFTMRTSIHGRRLGLSSTGAFISGVGSTGGGSTVFDMAAQMWGSGMVEVLSTVGPISNVGISVISSGSTSGTAPWTLGDVVDGAYKEIVFRTSSTRIVIETPSSLAALVVASSLGISSTVGSSSMDVSSTVVGIGGTITLRGLAASPGSTTVVRQWIITSRSPHLILA